MFTEGESELRAGGRPSTNPFWFICQHRKKQAKLRKLEVTDHLCSNPRQIPFLMHCLLFSFFFFFVVVFVCLISEQTSKIAVTWHFISCHIISLQPSDNFKLNNDFTVIRRSVSSGTVLIPFKLKCTIAFLHGYYSSIWHFIQSTEVWVVASNNGGDQAAKSRFCAKVHWQYRVSSLTVCSSGFISTCSLKKSCISLVYAGYGWNAFGVEMTLSSPDLTVFSENDQ